MNAEQLLTHFDRIAAAPDAIPRLRRFVLDLTVRGKLMEQDPNDEPASELLRRIAAEKERLVKVGEIRKLKPQLRISPDDPFNLPVGWAWSTVGEICSKTGSGSTPRGGKNTYREEGIVFLRSQNVYDDGLRLDDVAYINTATHAKMSGTVVHPADLLLNITGGSIGRCCRVPDDFDEANVSQHVAIIRIAIHGLQDFVHRLILSPYFQSFIFGEQTGAGRGGLPKNKMDLIPLALPPLTEQHRIVAKVDELMALCDRLEATRTERETTRNRLTATSLACLNAPDPDLAVFQNHAAFALENLAPLTIRPDQIKALRQTILNLAVRGKLVEQNPNDEPAAELLKRAKIAVPSAGPFELPESWAWVNVSAVADSRLGKMLDKAKNKGTPRKYLRNINVRWFDFDLSDLLEMRFEDSELPKFALQMDDVMICEGGEPGRAAVWDARETDIYFQKAIHRVRFFDFVDSEFFVKALRASADDGRLAEYFTGTGIKHFTGKGLAAYLFPLPPLAEQHRIVAKVDELMAVCGRLEASLVTGDETRGRLAEAVLREALKRVGKRSEPGQSP